MDPDAGAVPPAHDALWSGRAETLTGLQRLLDVVGHMNGSEGLAETLEAVAEGIVVATGFQAVAIK
jgi:hypothetical protein